MSVEVGRPVHRVCDQRLHPLHCIHSRLAPGGAVSGVQNMQLSCNCGFREERREALPSCGVEGGRGGGEVSVLDDFGVGMVDGRSLWGGMTSLASRGWTEGVERVERLEGVVGSIVGEGGSRTRLTGSSSKSVSVTDGDILNGFSE